MTGDNWPKTRRADPLMTMTGRVGRNGTVVVISSWSLSTRLCVLTPQSVWFPPLARGFTKCSIGFVIQSQMAPGLS